MDELASKLGIRRAYLCRLLTEFREQHSRDEMDVSFTQLLERYARGSVLLTHNLPFSQWKGIFKDPMRVSQFALPQFCQLI